MKRIIISTVTALVFAATAVAQEGTVFRSISMDEALSAAAEEGKYVFVDCYTSWCGPCKNMTEKIFPQKKMGDYFNPLFVSVKFDIEKEDDGKRLSKEFEIRSIPTFLVLGPDGTLIHKIVGGSADAESFLVKVEETFDDGRAYGSLKKIYERGGSDKEFLMAAIERFSSVGDENVKNVVADLLGRSTFEEKISPDYWFIYSTPRLSPKGSENEQFLFDNYESFRLNIGREEVDKQLAPRYRNLLKDIVEGRIEVEQEKLALMFEQISRADFDNSEYHLDAFSRMADALVNGDMGRRIEVAALTCAQLGQWTYMIMYDNANMVGITPEQRAAWVAIGPSVRKTLHESDLNMFDVMINAITDRAVKREQEAK